MLPILCGEGRLRPRSPRRYGNRRHDVEPGQRRPGIKHPVVGGVHPSTVWGHEDVERVRMPAPFGDVRCYVLLDFTQPGNPGDEGDARGEGRNSPAKGPRKRTRARTI